MTEGCKRSKPLDTARDAERNRSALSTDVTPWVFGFFVALIVAGPLGFLVGLPPLGTLLLVLLLTVILGAIKAKMS